ncbi:MAG: GNAT family N-acetyltransferase [Chloroflexi bacterium]|nr:GNAT family N-acetyltransferase [Chloroflexota bacterium]
MNVRQLVLSDIEAVESLDHAIRGPDRSKTWDFYIDRVLRTGYLGALPHPPWGCFVAENDDELIGFIVAERQMPTYGLPPGARIVALAVGNEYRRRGVGKALVDKLVEGCRKSGLDNIYSILLDEDDRDASFLESAGFGPANFKVFNREI